jgi:hypothetical protein
MAGCTRLEVPWYSSTRVRTRVRTYVRTTKLARLAEMLPRSLRLRPPPQGGSGTSPVHTRVRTYVTYTCTYTCTMVRIEKRTYYMCTKWYVLYLIRALASSTTLYTIATMVHVYHGMCTFPRTNETRGLSDYRHELAR